MSDNEIPKKLTDAVTAEGDRHTKALANMFASWPEFRKNIALYQLGCAVGVADSMGVDVEAFLTDLRSKYAKPAVLVPPERH
jgi:hypothetical protein